MRAGGCRRAPGHALGGTPKLAGEDAFYSVVRRLTEHLREVGCPHGGPTRTAWCSSGQLCGLLGHVVLHVHAWDPLLRRALRPTSPPAFGHNWVHQPKYRTWAYLSLDTIGFSSTGWFREHVLQHHMYTNTPWDNHFRGTDPFLVTDPTVPRNRLQRNVMPYANPLLLTFGLYANWFAHLVETLHGNEKPMPTKLLLPLQIALMVQRWGLHGAALVYVANGVLGVWYFSMALMNHNAEHTHDVKARNDAKDWGEQQLVACADWGVQLPTRRGSTCGSTTTPSTTSSRASTFRTTRPRSASSWRRPSSLASSMWRPTRR